MGPERVPTDERVRRQVGRTLSNAFLAIVVLVAAGAWAYTGMYQLDPGEAAVVLRLGAYDRTETTPGLRMHLPFPIERHSIVPVGTVRQAEFGYRGGRGEVSQQEILEAQMQTRDNNIVHLGFVVQYRVGDPFDVRYRVEDPGEILADAAQAAVREVVGRHGIDAVLTEARGQVEAESMEILQTLLDRYDSGLVVQSVQLQEVQPPEAVRDAFDDVLAALQDKDRVQNQAEGYANEVVPEARAEAVELRESAGAYHDAKIAQASGEAERFLSLQEEYAKAPEVTRKRLYLEAMEDILPDVEKVIIEPGTTNVLPHLPLGRQSGGAQR